MKRITMSLPDDLAAATEREASRRRIPVSQVVREALQDRLGQRDVARTIPFAALGRSGHRTTARDVDQILAAEWTDDRGR
jgi:metal-responsive CopG/Arc/MetJ family transcriptional regulator